jgi:hypothetical protein
MAVHWIKDVYAKLIPGLHNALASIGPTLVNAATAVYRLEEDTVQTLRTTALISAAMIAIACGKDSSKSAINSDLKRDLDLAASSATDLASAQKAAAFSPTEIAPSSAPVKSPTLKKAPGKRVVRTNRPTIKASPMPTEVAAAEVPDVNVTATSPAPESAPAPKADDDVPAMARPTPAQIPQAIPAGQGSEQGQSTGSGIGAVLGGIFGVVIRGGGVDGDRCEPHGRNGRGYPGRRNYPGDYGVPTTPTSPGIPSRGRIYVRQR